MRSILNNFNINTSMVLIAVWAFTISLMGYFVFQNYQMIENHKKTINEINTNINKTNSQINEINKSLSENNARNAITQQNNASDKEASVMDMVVTAYTLSVESCGKAPGEDGYGLTASGINLSGHSLESARAIAVDPDVIPLGSKVRINFNNPKYQHLNGVYDAIDTGGAIIGNRIDLFFGEFSDDEAMEFGIQNATAYVI